MDALSPLRVGLVGCGYQGQALASAVGRSDRLQLVAVADPDAEAARQVAPLGAALSVHESERDLLAAADVDAVLVATPHHLLAPLTLEAIRAGKHVLVEKPVALNEAEAKEVEFAAASAGVTCMAGYTFRYGMAARVRDLFDAGAVGDLVAITGSIRSPRMDEGWIAEVASGGGPLLYLGCHQVDLMLWLAGQEPVAVAARVSRRDSGVDDTSAIQLDFGNGPVGQLLVTQSASGFYYDLHVVGAGGRITLRGRDFVHYEIEVQSTVLEAYAEPTILRPEPERDAVDLTLTPELADFADAIDQGRPPGVTASDARRVLRVLDAVWASARSGGWTSFGTPMLAAF